MEASRPAVDAASAAYEFGVMPGDESDATDDEIRTMAERVLRAAHDPDLGLDRSVCLRDVVEALSGHTADHTMDARLIVLREFMPPS